MINWFKSWLRNASRSTEGAATLGDSVNRPDQAGGTIATANNQRATAAIEERDRRFARGLAKMSSPGRSDWPPPYTDPFPGLERALPEIPAADLTVDIVGGAVAHHGALIIRGLLTPEQVTSIREMQDRVRSLSVSGKRDHSGWYVPFKSKTPIKGKTLKLAPLRSRIEGKEGNWLVDSPLGLELVLEHLERAGVIPLVEAHFGERPAISLQKCTLRTVEPRLKPTGWHQDGSFLGEDVRSMNLWVALSNCGGATPAAGMEIIPTRLEDLYHIPPDFGATAQAMEVLEPLVAKYSLVVPEFAPGDGIMFDEKLMHRTAFGPHISEVRYALECWFFAPSHSAENYSPLLV